MLLDHLTRGYWEKAKRLQSMGVISCRRKEASLIPNHCIYELKRRRNVTAIISIHNRGCTKRIPACWNVTQGASQWQWHFRRRRAARESKLRSGKTDHPASLSSCARYVDNDIGSWFACLYGVTTLCDGVPRWFSSNQRGGRSPGWEPSAVRSRSPH